MSVGGRLRSGYEKYLRPRDELAETLVEFGKHFIRQMLSVWAISLRRCPTMLACLCKSQETVYAERISGSSCDLDHRPTYRVPLTWPTSLPPKHVASKRTMRSVRMERRAITVEGIVQGVGFRPFVYALALRLELRGFVKNQSGRVLIEAEGTSAALDRFTRELREKSPPLARIDALSCESQEALRGENRFRIEPSDHYAGTPIFISPDVATCDACLAELFDPSDRHYRYPFLNCTNCGPRLTIIRGAPYDRARTTLASFPMCPACAAEYNDPGDRRFHAQPAACPACGPRLSVCQPNGEPIETSDPLAFFIDALRRGRIGALKGLGGFHLTCDAAAEDVVGELRRRKHRDEKPFAVMVPDLATAERFCQIDATERELLRSPRRPIVLLNKRKSSIGGSICEAVAPRNPRLGVMLPYTPLHHLLLAGFPWGRW